MLEAYSEDMLVGHDSTVTFDNVAISRGIFVDFMEGTETVYLRFPGMYEVEVCASCTPMESGLMAVQLYEDGEARQSACSGSDGADIVNGGMRPMNFRTYVRVPWRGKRKAICVKNVGVPAIFDSVTLLVRKL